MSKNQKTATAQRTGRHKARPTIGFLTHGISDEYGSPLWTGVLDAALEADANLICFAGSDLNSPRGFDAQANVLYDLVSAENVDGLVISGGPMSNFAGLEGFKAFCERHRPLPIVNIAVALEGIPTTSIDNYQGVREVMEHLISAHGYRRIALIPGPQGNPEAEARYRAYADSLAEHGLPLDPSLVSTPGNFDEVSGAAAVCLLLDERQAGFDAVMATSDGMAIGAMGELQARGIDVPHDVAVVGFNGSAAAQFVTPPLTTVHQPIYEEARLAVDLVLAQLRGEQLPEQTSLPTRLVIRESCGCLDPLVVRAAAASAAETNEPFDVAFVTRRESILSAMAHEARDPSDNMPERVEQLVDAFSAEVSGRSPGGFLATLGTILRQAVIEGSDVTVWQEALSALRFHARACLSDSETLLRVENLWQQARLMIGTTAQRAQAHQRLQVEQQTQVVRDVGQRLITTLDRKELMDVLAEEMPRLGIPSCYLSLYEDPTQPATWSRLMLACNEQEWVELEPDEQRFPSRQLLPEGMWPQERRFSFVAEPLYFRQDQIGLALFEVGSRAGRVYEALQSEISSALRGTLVLEERKRTQEALQQSETQLKTILDNVQAGIVILDPEAHVIVDVNPVAARLIGAPRDEIVGEVCHKYICPADQGRCPITDLGQSVDNSERELLTVDGRKRPIMKTVSRVMLAGRIHLLESFVDITQLKRAQQVMERHALQLQTASDVSRAVSSILDPDRLMQQVVDLARERFDLYYAGLFLMDESGEWTGEPGKWAVLRAGTGKAGRQMLARGHKLRIGGTSMIGQCVAIKQARIALDVGREAVRFDNPYLPETRSELAVPLVSRGQAIGALTIQSTQEAAFSDEDIAVFQTMADQLANAIQNARLYDHAQKEIAERKQMEEALAFERDLLRALMQNLPDHIYFKDTYSRFIRINTAQAHRFGLSDPTQAVGKTDFDFFTEEHARPAYENEQNIMKTGQPMLNLEEKETWPDRPDTWVSTTKMPLRDETGSIVGTFGISRDITDRKRMEEALARERNLLRSLIDNVPDYIYVKDTESRFITGNPAVLRLMGVAGVDDLVGKTDFEFYPADLATKYYGDEQTIMQSGQPLLQQEEPVVDATGNPGWISTIKVPLRDVQGKIFGLVGMGRDITERKRVEMKLERRAVQLRAAAEVARDATTARDLDELLNRAVNLVRDRFGFYHAGIFLVDEQGEYAILTAASGQAGQAMLEDGYKLKVGGTGIVGYVTRRGQPRIALDVGADAVHFRNPYLPETRSELALPFKVGGRVIGALDVQSQQPAAFDEEDVQVLQIMADQLAVAIENVRLVTELQSRLREISVLYQSYSQEAWSHARSGDVATGYEYDRARVMPLNRQLSPDAVAQLKAGQLVTLEAEQAGDSGRRSTLIAPLMLRGQMIGAVGFEQDDPDRQLSAEDRAVIEAVTSQVALALENARLFEEAQRRASREELTSAITARIRASLDIDTVLKTAVEEMRQALGLPEVVIRLVPPAASSGDSESTGHNGSKETLP
jgi:PAS domain S-box-containing protein